MLHRMRARRKAKGLTQEEIGKRVGIQQRRYSSYETGIRSMPVEIAHKIAKVLEVNWWELYDEEE